MNANDFPAEYLNQQKTQRAEPRAQDSGSVASIGDSDLPLKDEVYQIVGCAMEVLNELGPGLHEMPYENALMLEFGLRKIQFVQLPLLRKTFPGTVSNLMRKEAVK